MKKIIDKVEIPVISKEDVNKAFVAVEYEKGEQDSRAVLVWIGNDADSMEDKPFRTLCSNNFIYRKKDVGARRSSRRSKFYSLEELMESYPDSEFYTLNSLFAVAMFLEGASHEEIMDL